MHRDAESRNIASVMKARTASEADMESGNVIDTSGGEVIVAVAQEVECVFTPGEPIFWRAELDGG